MWVKILPIRNNNVTSRVLGNDIVIKPYWEKDLFHLCQLYISMNLSYNPLQGICLMCVVLFKAQQKYFEKQVTLYLWSARNTFSLTSFGRSWLKGYFFLSYYSPHV